MGASKLFCPTMPKLENFSAGSSFQPLSVSMTKVTSYGQIRYLSNKSTPRYAKGLSKVGRLWLFIKVHGKGFWSR
ncbi:uncharacterized protein PgNI_07868, partial [Pyricularia grisea]|uniref:Uncharacterized protein n=1 Tax=Pyricularia grisea TaxID=148305 RepID=A0A6P8B0T5_PYRGI